MQNKWYVPLVAVAVLSPLTLPPGPAFAGQPCPARSICLYVDGGFNGPVEVISGAVAYKDLEPWMHDKASSWRSTTRRQTFCVFDHVRGGKRVRLDTLAPGKRVAVVPDRTNDRADAVGFCR